mgnify:CR=1 FL=1
MQFKVRKAKNSDFSAVLALAGTEFQKPPFNENWKPKILRDKFRAHFKHCTILVAEQAKSICGFIIFHTEYLFSEKIAVTNEFVVCEKFQGQGIGSNLLKATEKLAKKNKTKIFTLLALPGSEAYKFYTKRKYKKSGWELLAKKI